MKENRIGRGKSRGLLALAALFLIVLGAPARAENILDAPISFSAERTVTIDGRAFTGPMFHAPGRERDEQSLLGMEEVFILDAQTDAGYLVLQNLKTYVAFPFPPLLQALLDPSRIAEARGHDVIDHIPTIKYRIDKTAPDGSRGAGFAWISKRGVLMKLAGTITAPQGHQTKVTMVLSRFREGPQDPRLFTVPKGLHQLPAAALAPLFGLNFR
jgi:hypothetical protein